MGLARTPDSSTLLYLLVRGRAFKVCFINFSVNIKNFCREDKEGVKRLISSIFMEIFNYERSRLEDIENVDKNYDKFLVAEEGGKIIGTIGLCKKGKSAGEIRRMYVAKEYRRKGVGTLLYNKIEAFSKKNGIIILVLSTAPEMRDAIEFYTKNGFDITEETKQSDKSPYRRIFMEKKLK